MVDQFDKEREKMIKEKEEKLKSLLERIENLPRSLQLSIQGELNNLGNDPLLMLKQLKVKEKLPSPKDMKNFLYGRVCFRSENFIANIKDTTEKFDTIICLSTTKWIHLNFGDLGLKALFLKAYEQLEKGGIFIVEGHPWKSYKKKKNMCDKFKENFNKIKLRPHLFKEYLQKIGLRHITTFMPSESKPEEGFNRPIMVFKK